MSMADFIEANSGADESGIGEELSKQYDVSMRIINDEKYKIRLRNAVAKRIRNLKKNQTT